MAFTKHVGTTQNQVNSDNKLAGQIILTSDSQKMYWDVDDNTRIEITDIVDIPNEITRIEMSNPLDKFYYVLSTRALWRFYNNTWARVGIGATDIEGIITEVLSRLPIDTSLERRLTGE